MSDPAPSVQGQRSLAAIVFTDVVNFSAKVGQDEERTLALVRRDIRLMTEICARHEGQVLKTMGDGLLLYFISAVQAVGCAQDIQLALAEVAKSLPTEDILIHRIGIHLGDVFVSSTDVMGDGVNVASRLQGEAEPGGICLSQTVYDVVKNKLSLQATYLGPRELKNIRDAVPVYQILLAAQGYHDRGMIPRKAVKINYKKWIGVSAGIFAVILLVGALIKHHKNAQPEKVTVSSNSPVPVSTAEDKNDVARFFLKKKEEDLSKYDFEGIANWLRERADSGHSIAKKYLLEFEQLAALKKWLIEQCSNGNTVKMRNSKGERVDVSVSYQNGKFKIEEPDGSHFSFSFENIKEGPPRRIYFLIQGILEKNDSASSKQYRDAANIFFEEYKDEILKPHRNEENTSSK